jgi:predicted esterase
MCSGRILVLVAAFHLVGADLQAQDPRAQQQRHIEPVPLTPHRTGSFDATLPARSPESDGRRWAERFGFRGDVLSQEYDLAKESFNVYVPEDYDPTGEPFGLVVWVSPFRDGAIPADFRPVFDERHLIWIGANDAGNERSILPRMGLALDAVASMALDYNIEPTRVLVSGLSGGGRVSSMLAVAYPDLFAGGFPIIGVNSYLRIRLESDPSRMVPTFSRPPRETLDRARTHPFVIMTGSGDFNREECRLTARAYEENGFTDMHFIDVHGMGHEMPSPGDFAKGLDFLLAPAAAAAATDLGSSR